MGVIKAFKDAAKVVKAAQADVNKKPKDQVAAQRAKEVGRQVMTACTSESGTCHECQSACQVKPGWFLPGEAEKAADLLGMPMQEFFDRYLAVDWWEGYPKDTFILSPAVVGESTGDMFPAAPRGQCVFYQEGQCQIHEAKPHECRQYWCGEPSGEASGRHRKVAEAWDAHQPQITSLLGREPEAEEWEGGLFGGLFS